MKITIKEMERLEYRKQRLLSETKKLEAILSGRNTDLGPRTSTGPGKHSEKKVWEFVEQMVDALEKYEKYAEYDMFDEAEEDISLEEADGGMTEDRKRFYRSFLYCALRVTREGVLWPDGEWRPKYTFDSVLKLAEKTPFYGDKYELYFSEMYKTSDGFFYYMDEAYRALTGNSIESTISEEDKEEVKKRYAYQAEDYEMGVSVWREAMEESGCSMEELAAFESRAAEAEWDLKSEKERKRSIRERERFEKWKEGFPEKDIFCRQYELCRELYFKKLFRPEELAFQIERMMDIYLYEHGTSRFMDDEAFFYTFTLLKRTVKQAGRALPEGLRDEGI